MSIARKCNIAGCNDRHMARSYCSKHYQSWRKNGDALFIEKRRAEMENKKCSVEGCNSRGRVDATTGRRYLNYGMCSKHYAQVRRNGAAAKTIYDDRQAIIEGDIAKIPLGVNAKDGYAIVDKDFAWLDDRKWYLDKTGYARNKSNATVSMHQIVHGDIEKGMYIDHINRDKLDNRKVNLRKVTPQDNTLNRGASANSTSKYKGVSRGIKGVWIMQIRRKKRHIIKTYRTEIEAALAYNAYAKELHGEFAYQNEVR